MLNTNGGKLTDGTFRLDLDADDLAMVGTKELQQRELTLIVTHSGRKQLPIVVRFPLRTFADVA